MTTQRANDDFRREASTGRADDEPGAVRPAGGRLLIYLGAAAGVGKTHAMLDEARRWTDLDGEEPARHLGWPGADSDPRAR